MNIKQESENKNIVNEYRYFLKSNFAGVNRLFVLIYLNKDNNAKNYKAQRHNLYIKNYKVVINGEKLL